MNFYLSYNFIIIIKYGKLNTKIKQIIREEYYNVMNEGFADPEIRKLARLGGLEAGKWTNFFRSFAKTHNIAWDKLPAGTLNKTNNMNDPKINSEEFVGWVEIKNLKGRL